MLKRWHFTNVEVYSPQTTTRKKRFYVEVLARYNAIYSLKIAKQKRDWIVHFGRPCIGAGKVLAFRSDVLEWHRDITDIENLMFNLRKSIENGGSEIDPKS